MSEEERLKELIRKLEESYIEGKISSETYRELKAKYEAQLAEIQRAGAPAPTPAPPPTPPHAPPPTVYAQPERGVFDILSDAFRFCTANYIVFVPFIAAAILTSIISLAILGATLTGWPRPGPAPPQYGLGGFGFIGSAIILYTFLVFLIYRILEGWTVAMVSHGLQGRPIDLSLTFSEALGKIVPLVIAGIVVAVAVTIGLLLCVIPGIILFVLLALTTQAIMIDDHDAIEALSVSFNIGKNNFLTIFAAIFLPLVAYFIVAFMFTGIVIIPVVSTVVSSLIGALFLTYLAVVLTMIYYDKRKTVVV